MGERYWHLLGRGPLITQNYWAQDVNSTEVWKPCSQVILLLAGFLPLLLSQISLFIQGAFIFSGMLDFHMKTLQSPEHLGPFLSYSLRYLKFSDLRCRNFLSSFLFVWVSFPRYHITRTDVLVSVSAQ